MLAGLFVVGVGYLDKLMTALRPVIQESPQTWDDKLLAFADKGMRVLYAVVRFLNLFNKPKSPK